MGRKSSISKPSSQRITPNTTSDESRASRAPRMYSQGLALVRLVAKDYDKYKANTLVNGLKSCPTTPTSTKKLPAYRSRISWLQLSGLFITQLGRKNSTGFGDVEEINAHEILLDICKYWYYDVIYNLIVGTSSFQSWDNRR